jgi:glycosyltransferase involved in cell wall biosynthesis
MPLISIILPARNAPQWTGRALASIRHSVNQLGWLSNLEMILLDDNSELQLGIIPLFVEFRKQTKIPCRIIRFKDHQHYSRVFGAGLSLAQGEKVIFLSNDMIFTPDFFRLLLEVSNRDKTIGIVRGTSNYVDSHPEHSVAPPFPLKSFGNILLFSQYVASHWNQEFVEDTKLSGDAVLINRALINAIGVIDPIYFSYFGDVDYGLRTMRAGFKLVCAKGAWLFHEGAGHIKDQYSRLGPSPALDTERELLVQKAYETFRNKWDTGLPLRYDPGQSIAFPECRDLVPLDRNRYVPPVTLSGDLCEFVEEVTG